MSKASRRHHEIPPEMVLLHSEPNCGQFLGLQAVCWIPSPSRIRLGSRRRLTLSPQQTDRTEISRLGSDMPPATSVLYCAHPAPRVYAPARYLLMILKWSREWSTAWVGCTKIIVAHQGIEGERNIARFPDRRSCGTVINQAGHLEEEDKWCGNRCSDEQCLNHHSRRWYCRSSYYEHMFQI